MPTMKIQFKPISNLIAVFTLTILSSCMAAPQFQEIPSRIVILDAELKRTHENTNPSLPPLPRASGAAPIQNCNDLLAVLRQHADIDELREQPHFSAYMPCLVAAVIRHGKPPQFWSFDLDRAGIQIFSALDLNSVRSSLAPRRPSEHYRLADFKWSARRVEPHSLRLATPDFRYDIDVLAAGDFQGTGQAELLVRLKDQAFAGTYDATSILILSWPPGRAAIEATDAVEFLGKTPSK